MRVRNPSLSNEKTGAFRPLYTPEQRRLRDESRWTLVQGILAPIQFLIFLISLALVVRYLTGSIWEKVVFGKWLFAAAFFWEDVFSMLVLALHSAYLVALIGGLGSERGRMLLALSAYATYAINATQFLLKLRAARLQMAPSTTPRLAGALAG
jgi:3-vinyl bacteriochlorophyllide hydratase